MVKCTRLEFESKCLTRKLETVNIKKNAFAERCKYQEFIRDN